jgi:hypothetical protein
MKLHDHVGPGPRGFFRLEVRRHGRLIRTIAEDNLWLTSGRHVCSALLGGTSSAVNQFGLGTNGTPPQVTDTVLTSPFYVTVGTPVYPDGLSVQFPFSISTSQANGMLIAEFGLLNATPTLVARKVALQPIPKTSAISLAGTWTISF